MILKTLVYTNVCKCLQETNVSSSIQYMLNVLQIWWKSEDFPLICNNIHKVSTHFSVHNIYACQQESNIAFARGGAHLPIAHALRLPETEIISWSGDFWGGGGFFGAEGPLPLYFFKNLLVRVKLGSMIPCTLSPAKTTKKIPKPKKIKKNLLPPKKSPSPKKIPRTKKNQKNPNPTKLCLSLASGVRALWVSEHPLWRTRY